MQPRPRAERDRERIDRAAAAARTAGAPALQVCLARIGAAFDEAAAANAFKMRVERLMRLGPDHPALQARFGARAALLADSDLAGALATVERWWREERKALQLARAFGHGSALSLDVLRELRLILRLMRWKRMDAEFGAVAAKLRGDALAMAAE